MEDKGWKSKPLGLRTHKTSSWIQSLDEMTLGINLILSTGLISSIGCRSVDYGILR